jgi:hypothetical protein
MAVRKWEHYSIWSRPDGLEEALDRYGEAGWELVSVTAERFLGNAQVGTDTAWVDEWEVEAYRLFFKRPKEAE